MMSLIVFFLTSSRATKFRSSRKRRFEEDFKEGTYVRYNIFSPLTYCKSILLNRGSEELDSSYMQWRNGNTVGDS